MHEFAIASQLIDRAIEAANERGAERIERIDVALGEATHLNPDQLQFCIETVATDTIADGAAIHLRRVAPHGECSCGWTGVPRRIDEALIMAPDLTCPECGNRLELTRGRECRLEGVTIPETGENTCT